MARKERMGATPHIGTLIKVCKHLNVAARDPQGGINRQVLEERKR